MAKVSVNKISNANTYLNGTNHCGKAEEVKLPDVVQKMLEHKGLGTIGSFELPAGLDKMESTIKWSSLYRDVMVATANPYKANTLMVRGNLETWGPGGRSNEVPVVAFITGTFKKFPGGTFKTHDAAEFESGMSVTAFKLSIDGRDVIEVDVLANVYKVDGVDVVARFNANLGA